MIAISIENLSKKFEQKIAVDDLNLEINEGELFSLLGVNGAGKTTTIKMLSCLIKPTHGDAKLLGYSIISESDRVKSIINISPQETAVALNLTVKENLKFIAELYGIKKQEAVSETERILNVFSLNEVADSKAKILSGGMQRRLSIAMALITSPKILFLDEPTLGLDVIARRELWKTIIELKGKVTIILTTHYMEEAEALSDRVGIMANGKLKAIGTTEELIRNTNANNFEDAFVKIASDEVTK